MSKLTPAFDVESVFKRIDQVRDNKIRRMMAALSYVGISVVNHAKKNHTYQDQTGNLTASIGYAIIVDGKIVKATMMYEESAQVVDKLAAELYTGMILVVVAGMEYAAAVESKGYDVITSGAQIGADTIRKFKELLKEGKL